MAVPKRTAWVALKKKHGIADKAVSGVSLGPIIDKVDKATTGPSLELALKEFTKAANTYITKIDKKKVKEYPKFEKTFLDDYLGDATRQLEHIERAKDGVGLFKKELQRYFGAAQALNPQTSKRADLQLFTRMSRGTSSAGLRTGGAVDMTAINKIMTQVDTLAGRSDLSTQAGIGDFVRNVLPIVKRLADRAKAQHLV